MKDSEIHRLEQREKALNKAFKSFVWVSVSFLGMLLAPLIITSCSKDSVVALLAYALPWVVFSISLCLFFYYSDKSSDLTRSWDEKV